MTTKLLSIYADENGQGTTEYGLVLGVIAVGVVGIVLGLKQEIYTIYDKSVRVIEQAGKSVGILD